MSHAGIDTACRNYRCMTRRQWLRRTLGAAGGASFLGLLRPEILYALPGTDDHTADALIILWMGGGMSHIDTFDPQPGSEIGGPFAAIDTTAEGIRIAEHLPLLGRQFKHLSLIRSLTSSEGEHDRATYQMHTGYVPLASVKHSTLGSIIARYRGRSQGDPALPPYVSIGIDWAAGYLGPKYAPYYIGHAARGHDGIRTPEGLGGRRFNERLRLLKEFDRSFRKKHRGDPAIEAFAENYNAALLMMSPRTAKVFDLDDEPLAVREAYGMESAFGQGCLLARRLVKAGARCVEVSLGGWDTHADNFEIVKSKCGELDRAASALIGDLRRTGLFERTIVLLASEFGRTPSINDRGGRDHFPQVFSAVIGGGGLAAGRLVGGSDGGRAVGERAVRVGELHATLCAALGIDYAESNVAPDLRPFRIVKDVTARPIHELLG
jgi:hypothetical protein